MVWHELRELWRLCGVLKLWNLKVRTNQARECLLGQFGSFEVFKFANDWKVERLKIWPPISLSLVVWFWDRKWNILVCHHPSSSGSEPQVKQISRLWTVGPRMKAYYYIATPRQRLLDPKMKSISTTSPPCGIFVDQNWNIWHRNSPNSHTLPFSLSNCSTSYLPNCQTSCTSNLQTFKLLQCSRDGGETNFKLWELGLIVGEFGRLSIWKTCKSQKFEVLIKSSKNWPFEISILQTLKPANLRTRELSKREGSECWCPRCTMAPNRTLEGLQTRDHWN